MMKLAWAVWALLVASATFAAENPKPPPTDEQIARAVKQLSAPNFETREAATKFLWEAGRAALPRLREAAKSSDPEVATRAQIVLDNVRFGVLPDTSASMRQMVDQYQKGSPDDRKDVLGRLLSMDIRGQRIAFSLLEEARDPEWQNAMVRELKSELISSVRSLIVEGDYDPVETALRLSAAAEEGEDDGLYRYLEATRNYAAFLLWRGKLTETIKEFQHRWTVKPTPVTARTLAILHRAAGDLAKARLAAENAGDPHLVTGILAEQGAWEEIAGSVERKRQGGASPEDGPGMACLAAYHRLAGHEEIVNRYLDELWKSIQEGRKVQTPIFRHDAFSVNAQPERAAALLEQDSPQQAIAHLFFRRRFKEALELCAKSSSHADSKTALPIQCDEAKILFLAGDRDRCAALLQSLQKKFAGDQEGLKKIVKTCLETECFSVVQSYFAQGDPKQLATNKTAPAWQPLRGRVKDVAAAGATCWRVLRRLHDSEPVEQTLRQQHRLLAGMMQRGELMPIIVEAADMMAKTPTKEQARSLLALSRVCDAAGITDLAIHCAQLAADKSPDTAELIEAGMLFMKQGRFHEAAELFARAWQNNKTADSLLLRGWAMVKDGHAAEGEQLMRAAEIVSLAEDCGEKDGLLQIAATLGLPKLRESELELVRRTGAFFPDCDCSEPLALAEQAAQNGEYFQAAAIRERMLFSLVCGRSLNGVDFRNWFDGKRDLRHPSWIYEWRARGYLKERKVKEAMREARLCLASLPGDVSMPMEAVPALDALERRKEADEIFDAVFQFLDKTCTDFPRYAEGHHDLAKLTLACRRKLEVGLTHAQKSVDLDPQNAACRETLEKLKAAQPKP